MLKIILSNVSALMLGSGTGQGSYIDSDIILDDNGLPLFPGRRLKGLLKESAQEVLEMLNQAGLGSSFAEDIIEIVFGTGTRPAGIRVDNLYLADNKNGEYKAVTEWIKYLKKKHSTFINKEAIVNALTSIRQQTAINEEGYAKQGSLRTMRVFQAKREFYGIIEILNKNREQEIAALLALACSNLRRVGSGRNRGWGEVECRLYDEQGQYLNEQIIDKLNNLQSGEAILLEVNHNCRDAKKVELKDYSGEDHTMAKLPYHITSSTPLLFTSPDGDENIVNTLDYIPGSALHGFYANRFIRENKLNSKTAHQDLKFKSWFLDGCLNFSNAYPRKNFKGSDRLFYPIPLFLHTDKDKNYPYNLLAYLGEEESLEETKALGGYCAIQGNEIAIHKPEKEINFHLVRNKDAESRIEGHTHEGGIFHYEAIKAGQEFSGYILGSKAELEQFRQMFDSCTYLRIGRSMNTQYGRVRIKFDEISLETASEIEFLSSKNDNNPVVELDNNCLMFYLAAPLVLYNRHGVNTVDEKDLLLYLQTLLGVPKIKVICSFTRIEQRSGFASHLKIFEPSFRCWAAGSSFLLELTDKDSKQLKIDEELETKIRRIMVEGLGEQRQMGFGRVVFSRNIPDPQVLIKKTDAEDQKPGISMPPLVKDIVQKVYQNHKKRIIVTTAAERAKKYYESCILSSNLLGRLERMCQDSKYATDFSNMVKNLRKTALEAIKKVKTKNLSLYNDLTNIDLEKWCKGNKLLNELKGLSDYLPAQDDKDDYKLFWRVFFRTMRRLRKKEEEQKLLIERRREKDA